MNAQEVHRKILHRAAELANERLPQPLRNYGSVFRPGITTDGPRFTLHYEPIVVVGLPDSIEAELVEVAREAVADALVEHQREFVGLIVGVARQGGTYL